MELNTEFKTNVLDIYGDAGHVWLTRLPDIIKSLSLSWNFRFLGYIPRMTYNFLGLVEMNASADKAIIKLAPAGASLTYENRWYSCITHGAPEIFQYDEKHNAILLEYLQPGQTLKHLVQQGKDDEATKIICRVIRELHDHQNVCFSFQHISELSGGLHVLKGMFDDDMLSRAGELFRELNKFTTNDLLLHGDLHHDNIISSGSAWRAIDPHGYMGDPAAEVGVMIRNPIDCFPREQSLAKTVARRLDIMANELGYDVKHLRNWAFCMTMLSIAWSVEDHGVIPEHETEIAKVLI